VVVLGGISLVAQVFLKYTRYVSVLKWLALSLLAYFGTVLVVKVPWLEALRGLLVPTFSSDRSFWTMVVALLGTTISPYLFFWQAAQEVEDTKVKPTRQPLVEAPRQARRALERIRLDTLVGMGFSNLVALAIMITTATTLHRHGVTDIQTSAQAAQALEPVAGRLAFTIFTLGVLGTGFLGIPVLAGSAAYALGEFRRWPVGLERRPVEAKAFYLTLSAATALGALINFSPVSPISALFWSAVINGVLAAPIMALVMLMAGNRDVMGRFTIRGRLRIIGWVATVVMGIASAGFFVTLVL
jgi:Mn2+/Fe2+ NRAMP family transporter